MKFYKVSEIAEMFKVTTRTVYRWIKVGRLNVVRPGIGNKSDIRIHEGEILRLMNTTWEETLPIIEKNIEIRKRI